MKKVHFDQKLHQSGSTNTFSIQAPEEPAKNPTPDPVPPVRSRPTRRNTGGFNVPRKSAEKSPDEGELKVRIRSFEIIFYDRLEIGVGYGYE